MATRTVRTASAFRSMLDIRPLGVSRRVAISLLIAGALATAVSLSAPLLATEGLACDDFANPDWIGPPAAHRIEADLTARLLGTSLFGRTDRFSVACEGWLFVTERSRMRFLLASDDGADLAIDGTTVVDNLGTHGMVAAVGEVNLMPGPHAVRVRYEQHGGDYGFALMAAADDEVFRAIDAADISQRPITRAEHRLRPLLRPAIASVLLIGISVLGWLWRNELLTALRSIGRGALAVHRAATPSRHLIIILIAAVGMRLVLTLTTHAILWADSIAYYMTARGITTGDWIDHEIFRTPGFSGFMAPFLAIGATPTVGLALIAVQRLLGVLTTLMVYNIACAAFSPMVAFYGALLWTLAPLPLYYETAVTAETLFVFLIVATIWFLVRSARQGGAARWALVGALCALAMLTRPVGKGLIFIIAAVVACYVRPPRRAVTIAAILIGSYLLLAIPWTLVNEREYGFYGISRGEGLGLFMRAYDVERFEPPEHTGFPDVKAAYKEQSTAEPYVHYRVRDELNFHRGYSALGADRAMEGFALEAIRAHPVAFVSGVALDWIALLLSPKESVAICDYATGPEPCSRRDTHLSFAEFPNTGRVGHVLLKRSVTAYLAVFYWLTPLLAPLALVGMAWSLPRAGRVEGALVQALLAAMIGYFTIMSVTFNTVEDRYRLPADPFLLLFAVEFVRRAVALAHRGEAMPVRRAVRA